MEFTAVGKDRKELGRIGNIKQADIEIGDTNTFEMTFLTEEWSNADEFKGIDYFFCSGEEIGGMIRKLKVMTEKGQVKASGLTWRGNLSKKVIEPPDGEAYRIVSGEANAIIRNLVDLEFNGLIRGSVEDSGFFIKGFKFDRYCTTLDGLNKMLSSVGAKLLIRYFESKEVNGALQRGYAEVSAVPVNDYSGKVEFSKDGRIHLTATDDRTGVNHLICLGKGELTERTVVHLYVGEDGEVTDTQYYTGIDEICETYDYSSVESQEELVKEGTKRLNERKNKRSIEITPGDIEVGLGDIVSGKEELTGISMQTHVVRLIYKIDSNGILKKEYKVGD